MAHTFGFCNVSVMPLRSDPTHKAEQTSQLLFGEKAEIIEVNNREWARIKCAFDGYEGWCKHSQLTEITRREYRKTTKYVSSSHIGKIIFESGDMALPLGCDLMRMTKGEIKTAFETGSFKGKKTNPAKTELTADNLVAAARQYMHAPYQWGGRSVAGIDCSGLTQMAFKLCNHKIPRDASQQANKGSLVDFLQHADCGDLAFFDNKDGNIVHVGILIDNKTIIHATDASGHVVIDRIDQGGIISITLRKRTHNLRFVKRIINCGIDEIPEGMGVQLPLI